MPRYRLVLEYDGTEFRGWQSQAAGARTVQGTLEEAARALLGQPVAIAGAGRTDAGVHAEGQVASFALPDGAVRLAPEALARALNAGLPADLAVRELAIVPDDFHPRRDACAKLYRYDLWNGAARSPLRRRRWVFVPGTLDVDAMKRAARDFEGTHDFAALQSTGSSVRTTKRTLLRCEWVGAGPELRLFVEGSGFLRHMVRTLAGTLIEVGQGRRGAAGVPALLAGGDRAAAGPTAPAHGLTLVRVRYPHPAGGAQAVSSLKSGG